MADQSNETDERINQQQFRVEIILFLLFQQHGYITIKELAKYINVSESKAKRDLQLVHIKLQEMKLQLESKSHIPSEAELNYLRKTLLLKKEMNNNEKNQMDELFLEKASENNYLDLIEKIANDMVREAYAYKNFPELVLQREQRFTTIYENGFGMYDKMEQKFLLIVRGDRSIL